VTCLLLFPTILILYYLQITVKFRDVQEYLRNIIDSETILVGHSMDTDLRVLQLVHRRIIDTACLFPHHSGLPYKHSLKKLAKDILDKDIQDSTGKIYIVCVNYVTQAWYIRGS
jgi:hypothetical protein